MKIQLTFDFDNREDEHRHYQCIRSQDMALALWEIAYNLRKKVEWEVESRLDSPDPLDVVFEHISQVIEDNNIDIRKIQL
jgi:hypothetical protein